MGRGRCRVDWNYVEKIIASNPNRTRFELANLGDCSFSSKKFVQLCIQYGVPNIQGKKPGRSYHRESQKNTKNEYKERASPLWEEYEVICPACREPHKIRLASPPKRGEKWVFCETHEKLRYNDEDQNTLYFVGVD